MRIDQCPVKTTIDVIGGKWKPLILFELKDGPRRFGQLRRNVQGIRHKVLTEQLGQLQQQGIVVRTIQEGKVLQSEYRLSDYGQTLRPVLESLAEWGMQHRRVKSENAVQQTVVSSIHL